MFVMVKLTNKYQIGIRCLLVNKMKYSPFKFGTSVPNFLFEFYGRGENK